MLTSQLLDEIGRFRREMAARGNDSEGKTLSPLPREGEGLATLESCAKEGLVRGGIGINVC